MHSRTSGAHTHEAVARDPIARISPRSYTRSPHSHSSSAGHRQSGHGLMESPRGPSMFYGIRCVIRPCARAQTHGSGEKILRINCQRRQSIQCQVFETSHFHSVLILVLAETLLSTERKLRRSAVTTKKALDFQVSVALILVMALMLGQVNNALRQRIEETRVSKDRLKAQLGRVNSEIAELESAKHKLEVTLQDKLNHMRVSGHCLRRRAQRPERGTPLWLPTSIHFSF